MKHFVLLLFMAISASQMRAQSTPNDQLKVNPKGTLPADYAKNKPVVQNTKPLPVPNNDGIAVDRRAEKYYGKENLMGMPTEKKKQINYVFRESYVLKSNCATVTAESFDVFPYRYKRKQSERVKISLENGCGEVELFSEDEINKAYQDLK